MLWNSNVSVLTKSPEVGKTSKQVGVDEMRGSYKAIIVFIKIGKL